MPYIITNKDTAPFPNYSFLGYNNIKEEEVRKKGGIYLIINEKNQNIYIGSSIDLCKRWKVHKSLLRRNKHYNKHLQNSWNKHGEGNFSFFVIEFVEDNKTLTDREQHFLDIIRNEYNICPTAGSTLNVEITNETKRKMRENHADFSGSKNPMYGVRLTGDKNPMFGKKRPDTAEFNRKTKKGKTWEELHGKEKAKKMKEALSAKMMNNTFKKPLK